MKTELKQYKVSDVVEGFVYNEFEGKGLYGLAGTLTIQPEFQRHYIYDDGKKDVAVIDIGKTNAKVVVIDTGTDGRVSSDHRLGIGRSSRIRSAS